MQTLDIFLEDVEKIFGDPDQARMARAQLHELKMTPSTTAEDYMAQFKMLAGRIGFNDTTLEDIYVWGLPNQFCRRSLLRLLSPMAWQHGRWSSEISTVSTEALQN